MKNQKPLISLIAIAIMGLLITSAASVSVKVTNSEEETITAEYAVLNCKPLSAVTKEPSIKTFSFDSNPVTGGDYDEYHPSVAGSPEGGFYALTEYYSEDDDVYYPGLYGSEDGVVWEPLMGFAYEYAEYTDMDQNEHGTYGTFGAPLDDPDNCGIIVVVQGEIQDGWVWNWADDGMDFFSHNRIASYTFEGPEGDPGEWNWGAVILTGDNHYQSNDITGCPFVFYPVSEESGTIGWLTNTENCENVGADMDTEKNRLYSVYDYYDEDKNSYQLMVRIDDFGKWLWNEAGGYWYHKFLKAMRIKDDENLTYPSVAAHNHNIIIACQKEDDVIAYYSTNGMGYKKEVFVEESASCPEVEFTGGGYVAVLTYYQYGNLWFKTSTDGGATWSDAELVTENQITSNDRAVQLDQYGGHVYGVWEDNSGDNVDIYFDLVYEFINDAPNAPSINGPTTGEPGEELTFTFKSFDPNDDEVKYIVDWGDGSIDTTDLYPSGEQVSLNHIWNVEDKDFTITAKAQDDKGAYSPESTHKIKIPRNKAINFGFFDFFPNLYRIFKILFG